MHLTSLISAGIAVAGAVIMVVWMPGRGAAGQAAGGQPASRPEQARAAVAPGSLAASRTGGRAELPARDAEWPVPEAVPGRSR
jgi:hypothetical protein